MRRFRDRAQLDGDQLNIIDVDAELDAEVGALRRRSRQHPPQAGPGANRARSNNNRRRQELEEAEMADFIVPDEDDWEMRSEELSFASEELSDDEIMDDAPRRPVQKRKRPAGAKNTRARGNNNNSRGRATGGRNNNGNATRAPRRTGNGTTISTSTAPIAVDDDLPFIDATGEVPFAAQFGDTMSQEDALAIAQALQDNENEVRRERGQRRINYDSEDDEITLRSFKKVRRT